MLSTLLYVILVSCCVCQKNSCPHLYEYPFKDISASCRENPNVMLKTPALIEENGYRVESYVATTDDGYILKLFRIASKEDDQRREKQPVILGHGIGTDSGEFLATGNKSIGFQLYEKGYDVWLPNFRGTQFSRDHVNLSSSDLAYWDYALDALAEYDMPAILATVLNVTKQRQKFIYLGHSRGTTLIFMWASQNPELAQEYFSEIVALSPVVYFDPQIQIKAIMDFGKPFFEFLFFIGQPVWFPTTDLTLTFFQKLCTFIPPFCKLFYDFFLGFNDQLRPDDLLLAFSQLPLTVEQRTLIHYIQNYKAGKFQKYDYGTKENQKKYGRPTPPEYHLSKINIPVILIYGKKDSVIKPNNQSVLRLYNELGTDKKINLVVPLDNMEEKYQFNHCDLTWGKYAEKYVNNELFKYLDHSGQN